MQQSAGHTSVNSLQLLLLHPLTYTRDPGGTYSNMHTVSSSDKLSAGSVSSLGKEQIFENTDPFIMCVLYRLMNLGCKSFVLNLALKKNHSAKRAVHCDLLGYNRKKDTMWLMSYARKQTQSKKTWLHARRIYRVVRDLASSSTNLKSAVVPLHVFENSNRVLFKQKNPYVSVETRAG